jgi:hypothetical protein
VLSDNVQSGKLLPFVQMNPATIFRVEVENGSSSYLRNAGSHPLTERDVTTQKTTATSTVTDIHEAGREMYHTESKVTTFSSIS